MSNTNRDDRIEALGQALFRTILEGGHGCQLQFATPPHFKAVFLSTCETL